jgi:hypothetical protein
MLSQVRRGMQWMKDKGWRSQPMTRLEALRLVIANGQALPPPTTSHRVVVPFNTTADAREYRRDPQRHTGSFGG